MTKFEELKDELRVKLHLIMADATPNTAKHVDLAAWVVRNKDRLLVALSGYVTLLAAAELLEKSEIDRQDCDECDGEGEPEACGKCFPAFDDARVMRRMAIASSKA